MYGCMSGLSILLHSSISIFMPLPHSFDYCSSVVTFGSGKYYYSNCVLFSRLFWPFRVPCNPIWIWGSVFLFLWKRLLGIWPELNWFCRSLWAIFSSVQFSRSVVSDSLRPHKSQHARPPCPSPTPGVHTDSHPSSQWCHPAISSSVIRFSSCPQSLPASESFPMSQLFTWGGQTTGVSALASFLPKKYWAILPP